MSEAKAAVRRLAAKQHGVFARRQALAAGLSRHAITAALRNGEIVQQRPGVYAVAGTSSTWERRAMVATLAAGDGAAVAHRAAAALLGITPRKPPTIEVIIPYGRKALGAKRARTLGPQDTRTVRGIRVTGPGRTLVDLAGSESEAELERLVDAVVHQGLATIVGLRRYIASRGLSTRPGVGVLQRILRDRERFGVPESELERLMTHLLRRFGLPQGVRQLVVGNRRLDIAYPSLKIAMELDGRRDHSKKAVFEDDRARQNELVLAGWTVLRFTWDDVTKRPERVADTIRAALRGTGGGS